MLRVCHVISGDLWAGAEVMACNLVRRLQECSDLDLNVVLLNEGRLGEELRTAGVPVHILDERRHSFPRLLQKARAYMREKPPQVIHSHRYKENILAFWARAAGGGTRLVATLHGLPESPSGRPRPAARLTAKLNNHLLARHFDRVVGVSLDIGNHFVNHLEFAPQRVSVIHNGIELPEPPVRGLSRTVVVGSAGRLFPVKDFPLMVEIARVAAEWRAPLRFELAGEGPEHSGVKELIAASGLGGSFRLHGHLPDVVKFYRRLDIYLNTSQHEGIPMSILEAMASGLPVVAPRVGGIGEIIEDGFEGFLVNGRNPKVFAERCLMLGDVDLRRRMGQAARQKVERLFSAKHMARQYHQLYLDLACGSQRGD